MHVKFSETIRCSASSYTAFMISSTFRLAFICGHEHIRGTGYMIRADSGAIQFTRGRSRTKDLGRHPARQTRDTSTTAITFNPERRAESCAPERRAADTGVGSVARGDDQAAPQIHFDDRVAHGRRRRDHRAESCHLVPALQPLVQLRRRRTARRSTEKETCHGPTRTSL